MKTSTMVPKIAAISFARLVLPKPVSCVLNVKWFYIRGTKLISTLAVANVWIAIKPLNVIAVHVKLTLTMMKQATVDVLVVMDVIAVVNVMTAANVIAVRTGIWYVQGNFLFRLMMGRLTPSPKRPASRIVRIINFIWGAPRTA
jgi:hypothetical protein